VKLYRETGAMSALCREFGISRKCGYKWAGRYYSDGVDGLRDRSRRPKSSPTAVEEAMAEFLLQARRTYPFWGPRKLRAFLVERNPHATFPAPSTIGSLFKRHGLVIPPKKRRAGFTATQPFADCLAPNDVWCADFKGDFPLDEQRCYPLTISDGFSRYLLRCKALSSTETTPSERVFDAAFREFGLPRAMRTDNGSPFAARAPGGLSRLAVKWVRLGIQLERIDPGHPEQNGRHERMHRTLKQEATIPPELNLGRQQRRFDDFRDCYNNERPHEALGNKTPASVYTPSPRAFPSKLPEIEYPSRYELRRVRSNGIIQWRGERIFLSTALADEVVGLEDLHDRRWRVRFGPIVLAVLDEKSWPPRIVVPRAIKKVSPMSSV
jgi:transposase InsO family protein